MSTLVAIDTHAHLWKNPEGLDALVESEKIEQVWLMEVPYYRGSQLKELASAEEILEVSRRYPGFFIPFGFVLSATLIKLGGTFEKNDVLITVVLCFTLSLFIEIVQAWIPSRSSSMLDLILNTLGALIGAIILSFLSYGSLAKDPESQ